jgi:hypothetical protein
MHGMFTRVSPAAFAERVGIPAGWFVISHRWIPTKTARRFAHGEWFKLSTPHADVYRVLRFSPNLEGAPGKTGQIVLDWPAWLDLYGRVEDVDGPLELEITKASWYEYPRLAISHPDPTFRLSSWIAVISLSLGVVSLLLGVWSVCIAYRY